jgi:hypothetical protein
VNRTWLGCERRGDRWYCHRAADLLALLGGDDDVVTPIDYAAAVAPELIEHLSGRGVHLAPGGHDLLHITGAPMTVAEARAVRRPRGELHRVLIDREHAQRNTSLGIGAEAKPKEHES